MSELEVQSLVREISGCNESEKKLILSYLAKNDIHLLIEAIVTEIEELKKLEEDMQNLFRK